MEWKEIAIAIGGFVAGLIFNLFVKVMPTYIDLSKENQELREKVRELESELEDERDRHEQQQNEWVDTKELRTAMDMLRAKRSKENRGEDGI